MPGGAGDAGDAGDVPPLPSLLAAGVDDRRPSLDYGGADAAAAAAAYAQSRWKGKCRTSFS